MKLVNYRKETSERSDALNWVKQKLIEDTNYHFESIEGCNQNAQNVVTHLLERARVDIVEGDFNLEEVRRNIVLLETEDRLKRKINFALKFDIPLSYVLYSDEEEKVYLFNINSLNDFQFDQQFNSYKEFADWISEIKGWKSSKSFRESDDLPYFDKQLRKHKTPWPTNIDCFFTDSENNPIGIIEYQNADRVGVKNHCNNDYLLCKQSYTNQWGYQAYHDDIRRWTSQEILRVQSGLDFYIFTWQTTNKDFIAKKVYHVSIPFFPENKNKSEYWKNVDGYKKNMNLYANNKDEVAYKKIVNNGQTFNFIKENQKLQQKINHPPLYFDDMTFPSIYYKAKVLQENGEGQLIEIFNKIIDK